MLLENSKIKLRAPEPEDLDTMYIIENDVRLWNDGVTFAPVSRKQLWDYISSYDGNIYSAGQLRLIIEQKCDGKVLGMVDLYDYDRINRRAYVGITVAEKFRSQGIGSATIQLIVEYAKNELDMFLLAAVVRADNKSSIWIFEKNGFIVTGRMPDWIRRGTGRVDALHMQVKLSDL